jgi:hypothetical protein
MGPVSIFGSKLASVAKERYFLASSNLLVNWNSLAHSLIRERLPVVPFFVVVTSQLFPIGRCRADVQAQHLAQGQDLSLSSRRSTGLNQSEIACVGRSTSPTDQFPPRAST